MDRGVADRALTEAFSADELKDAALKQGRKRWATLEREPNPRKRQKKLLDFLVRRGFDFGLSSEVVEGGAGEGP